jgi:hypothetical protein
METAPFRKSQVFYPHSISLINTAGFDNPKDYETPDLLKLWEDVSGRGTQAERDHQQSGS